ncbi:TlpA family protein disulfide reductase [Rickettsiales endosymbiont of Stachyamoeba lipophora]|uniref:TlpA family protein disulfide reductase n=1 Tax=Rickettsiales endosymbiont of Stachyamoeba lipophora TaxID=2486578 RepID=UPI000F64F2BA|nr:thioredoxin fold domain-containing protein [Rickettsiales endosymbiont of Stachyamoeba lipophora]AZL16051.1 hypothetical protein EF513_05825 [Rickettsiales endosymbiont of Stachyamoeba lipophora]
MKKARLKVLLSFLMFAVAIIIINNTYQPEFKGEINRKQIGLQLEQDYQFTELNQQHSFALKEINSKFYIINFIASWCNLCNKQAKVLLKLKEQYNIPIYAMPWHDSEYNINLYLEFNNSKKDYDKVLIDKTGWFSKELEIFALPTTLLVDENHQIRFFVTGVINEYVIKKYILPIIDNK